MIYTPETSKIIVNYYQSFLSKLLERIILLQILSGKKKYHQGRAGMDQQSYYPSFDVFSEMSLIELVPVTESQVGEIIINSQKKFCSLEQILTHLLHECLHLMIPVYHLLYQPLLVNWCCTPIVQACCHHTTSKEAQPHKLSPFPIFCFCLKNFKKSNADPSPELFLPS